MKHPPLLNSSRPLKHVARRCQDAQPLSRTLQTQEAAHSTLRISIIDRGYHRAADEDWDVKTATRQLWRARSFYQMSGDVCVCVCVHGIKSCVFSAAL